MVQGFVEMELPAGDAPDTSTARLQAGIAARLESVIAMRGGWRVLAERSDLPTAQHEWAVAAMNQLAPRFRGQVAYVSDGANIRATIPLLVKPRMGIEHLQHMSPAIAMPIDIPHTDRASLELLLTCIKGIGRPIHLAGMLGSSPAVNILRDMSAQKTGTVQVESATPAYYLPVSELGLQDRIQISARVSIIATSYGLSGGPNDVIFQFVSPSLDQVMQLFHESLLLHAPAQKQPSPKRPRSGKALDTVEFLKTYAFNCAQRGEIRFSCLRLAGRLLAVQMLQVRKRTAWLLTAGNLERFRDTTLGTLLMGETIRRLQHEQVDRLVVPNAASMKEIGECRQIPCVDVTIYPWSSRSIVAIMMGRARRASSMLIGRRRGERSASE